MPEHGVFEVIGETRDDAAGEAYDKVARTLSLPYPGGPAIDRLAADGEDTYKFPRVRLEAGSFDFSFSGLKSSVINAVHNAEQRGETVIPENLAASFQASVVEVLVEKAIRAVKEKERSNCSSQVASQPTVDSALRSKKRRTAKASASSSRHLIYAETMPV